VVVDASLDRAQIAATCRPWIDALTTQLRAKQGPGGGPPPLATDGA
jgi:hypothetical protein